MPRFSHPSKYFADDKDIADLLDSPKFSKEKLLRLALERGILLASELPKETLRDQLSHLPFSWPQLQQLLKAIETPDAEEKITTCKVETKASSDEVGKVLADIREIRGATADEAYIIRPVTGGTLIRITYSEVDHGSTRVLQRIRKEMEILIEPTKEGYELRYPANKRAETIVQKISDMLPVPEGEEKAKRQSVELAGVVDSALRSDFFIHLMDRMEGFRRRDVLDLKMNRIIQEKDEDDDDEETEQAAEELKGLVRKTSLSGESLLISPQYRQLSNDGFGIHRVIWEAMENSGKGRVYEIEAQFKNPDEGTGFCYLVRGVHNYDDDGVLEVTKRTIELDDRKRLNAAVEGAAYEALKLVKAQLAVESEEPNDETE